MFSIQTLFRFSYCRLGYKWFQFASVIMHTKIMLSRICTGLTVAELNSI